jgi:hypothetical protein
VTTAVINGSNLTVSETIDGKTTDRNYPSALVSSRRVQQSTGEKYLVLEYQGQKIIALANTPGFEGFGNTVFGVTDPDVANVSAQTLLGGSGSNGATIIKTPWQMQAPVPFAISAPNAYGPVIGIWNISVGLLPPTPSANYVVPAGKKLRITGANFAGWVSNWHTPGTTPDVTGIIDVRLLNLAGSILLSVPWSVIGQNGFTAEPASTHTPSWRSTISIPEGQIELPAGSAIMVAGGSQSPGNGYLTGTNIAGAISGYLF